MRKKLGYVIVTLLSIVALVGIWIGYVLLGKAFLMAVLTTAGLAIICACIVGLIMWALELTNLSKHIEL